MQERGDERKATGRDRMEIMCVNIRERRLRETVYIEGEMCMCVCVCACVRVCVCMCKFLERRRGG